MRLIVAAPEREGDVREWLASPGRGEAVKDNRVRSVHRWKGLFIKRFKAGGLWGRVRSLLADRALHEFRMLRLLRERGVDAPEPVAWARRGGESVLFTREIPDARPLREGPWTRRALEELAAFARRLLDAGIRHDDLHVGNILRAQGRLWLVDVHRAVALDRLTPAERAASLGFLVLSFVAFVGRTDVARFVRACGADLREVDRAFRKARERYWRDRQSRTRRTGSDFEAVDGMILRRPYTAEEARRALAAPPVEVVKEASGRRLWRIDAETFVKEGSPAMWDHAFGLELRGIPTPRLHACAGNRVVGRWVAGAEPLGDSVRARAPGRALLGKLAALVRTMHAHGVYHRDLKANNILVRGDELYVVDLDRVSFRPALARAERIWNLAQLNAAVGPRVTRTERLRFFFAYAGWDPEVRREWKGWVREIMERTRRRRHVWP
jgi:tRNA A-37 threonylcarbamoyl transferase component Bud32